MSTIGLSTQLSNLNLFKDDYRTPEDPFRRTNIANVGTIWER